MNLKRQKISGWFQLVTFFAAFTFTWVFVFPHEIIAEVKVQIPAMTRVLLTPTKTITPQEFKVGDRVGLVAASDVIIGGKVVIKAGAPATGEVTMSKRKGIAGQADKIAISLRSVQAVDGTLVSISGSKAAEGEEKMVMAIILALLCLPLILIPGGSASIEEGTTIEATVATQTTVTVR